MPDNRFTSPGVDTRFPSPGTDTRFSAPGTDNRFPSPGSDARFEDLAGFSTALTGLSSDSLGSYARIGNEAGISYSISPDNGTDTVAWDDNNPNSGSDYGTGANPTSLAALSGSTLYCHVTDGGDTVTKSVGVRYAPGSAAGALPDQNGWVENTAITTVDPTGDFTLTNLTGSWSASGLPAGVSINSGTGAITGTPTGTGSGSITVTFTDQYGRTVSNGFSYTVASVTVPDAFVDANWSVATGSGANELDITIASLPADNNGPITNVQYDIDGSGTWINLPSYAGTGTYTVTMAAASTSYDIRLRAVNSAGNGAAGNTESATSGAGAATVPSAFVDSDWSVAAGSDHKELDITIATVPNNGGAAITDIEYDVDASGSWVSLGTATTGTVTVTMAAGNTSYAIRLRAVNSVGNATAGNSESATSKALTITGYSFNGTDTISFSLNGTGTLYTSTTAASETDAADIEGGVAAIDTDTDVLSSGTNNITVSYPNTFDDNWLNLVAKSGSEYSNAISNQYTFGDIVPRAFVDANWSVATGSGSAELDITIASLPSNGGATVTDVEYDIDASGTWISLGATSGTTTVTMAAASTSYAIRLRAVNSVGNGLTGNSESATSGSAAATAPSAFVDANWSVATGSGANELDITIASLPANGGATITDVEYDVDGGGSWTSLAATAGTITITMAAASTSYGIRLRAVNSVGSGTAGNTESATSGASAGGSIPTIVGSNAASFHNAFTIAWPAGHASGDLAIVFVEYAGNQTKVVEGDLGTGWTELADIGSGTNSADCRMTVFTKTAASGAEADVTIPDTTGSYSAAIIVVSGQTAFAQLGSASSNASSQTAVSISGGTTTSADTRLIWAWANRVDSDTVQITAWADGNQSNVAHQVGTNDSRFGTGGGVSVGSGEKASTGAVGSVTATQASASRGCGLLIEVS